MKTCAIILAGGKGTRLRPATYWIPKALIPIKGKPIIEWQLDFLDKIGVSEVFIMTGYKHNKMNEWYNNYISFSHGIKNIKFIRLIRGKTSTKTFDRVMLAKEHVLHGNFDGAFVLNCDTLFNIETKDLAKTMIHERTCCKGDAVVLYSKIPGRADTLKNAGFYFLKPIVFTWKKYKNCMIEDLIEKAFHIQIDNNTTFFDIGTPEGYEIAKKKWKGNE